MDIAFQAQFKATKKCLKAIFLSTTEGGSGFLMGELLRDYFTEYFSRLGAHGSSAMPTSFNVVEAFMELSKLVPALILRPEIEYLIHLQDYLEWYTGDTSVISRDPQLLGTVMKESTIYSYELLGGFEDFTLKTASSQIGIVGVSMVRIGSELSVILQAGETPPEPYELDWQSVRITGIPAGKEKIKPSSELSSKDRFVPGKSGYGRVILMCRIDIIQRRFEVRYINVDVGPSFLVYTDDATVFAKSGDENDRESAKAGLEKYQELFSFVADLIYMPVYVVTRNSEITATTFQTKLYDHRRAVATRDAIDLLGVEAVNFHRSVFCLPRIPDTRVNVSQGESLNVRKTGRWLALSPAQIGQDEDGKLVVGRTWVSSYESWMAGGPESLLLTRTAVHLAGADPGTIYVMRSPSHTKDLYKIGLTRRNVEKRAQELGSATGVPLPLSILASWDVPSCEIAEKEIHASLASYRVNEKREFFLAPLSTIVQSIEKVIGGFSQ